MSTETCIINLERPVLDSNVYKKYHPPKNTRNPLENLTKQKCLDFTSSFLPFLGTLKKYRWKQDLLNDLISGITVGIMNIPQGLAYSVLALLPPVNGLYVSFLGPLLYAFLGQCPSFAIGTFALGSLLVGEGIKGAELQLNDGEPFEDSVRIIIACSMTFLTGVFQLLFGIIQLGSFSAIMAPSMVKAFNSAAAVHVFTSQIKSLFGMSKLKSKSGNFSVVMTYVAMVQNYHLFNWRTFVISIVAISILLFVKLFLGPIVKKKLCQFPIPIELFLVISFTLIFRFTTWSEDFNIQTVGNISRGMPAVALPDTTYFPVVIQSSIILAVVTTSINISLIKRIQGEICVKYNHEIFNFGIINIIGSFFNCFIFSGSLSRSLVAQDSGSRTPLAGIPSALFMFSILLYFSPYFSSLPKCILAAIVVVALKNLLLEIRCLPSLWRRYKPDFILFLVTYCVTVFVDITIGLLVGIVLCILVLLLDVQEVKFVETTRHKDYDDIFIPFLDQAKEKLQRESPSRPMRIYNTLKRKMSRPYDNYDAEMIEPVNCNLILDGHIRIFRIFGNFNFVSAPKFIDDFEEFLKTDSIENQVIANNLRIIIFDLDGVSKIDPYGVNKLGELRIKMIEKGVNIIFSGDLYRYKYLKNDLTFKLQPLEPLCLDDNTNNSFRNDPYVFATLLDAVHYSILFIKKFELNAINENHQSFSNSEDCDQIANF